MTTVSTKPASVAVGPRPLLVAMALGIVYVAWGSTYLAIRVMVEQMPALLGSGTRALAAGVLVAAGLAAWRGWQRLRVTRAQLAGCAAIGLLMPVAGQGLVAIAEDRGAPSGLTALLVASVPLWVACIRVLAGDRPPATSIVGVTLGFVGAAGLVAGHGGSGSAPMGALLIVVVASMAWALGSWLQPRLVLPADPFVVVVYEMLIGGTVLCILGVASGEHFVPSSYSAGTWLAWAYLLLIGSVLAFTAYNWLLRATSVSVAATYAYVNPVIAVFLGWLILSEPVTSTTLLCATVVVLGVALVVASEGRRRVQTAQIRKENDAR